MKKFRLTLKHDSGKFNISTYAETEEIARELVMKAENCPARAIVKVKEIEPRKPRPRYHPGVISVKEFNAEQDRYFQQHLDECKKNNVPSTPQDRYFPKVQLKYGYVLRTTSGHIWKKNKADFIY